VAADRSTSQDVALRDYVRVVWRRKWIVIGVTVVLLALALANALTKTPMYAASATLAYESPLDVSNPLSTNSVDSSQRQVELNAVASVIASPDLVTSARQGLTPEDIASGYSVSASPEEDATDTTSSSTVLITAVSSSPATAAHVANAYAAAFTAFRKSQEQAQVRQAEQVVRSKLDSFKSAASRQSTEYVTLLQRLQDLEILEATVTGNFRILVPAAPPTAPFSPKPVRSGAMGLAAGFVLGVGIVLLLDQFDTRVRTADEASAIFGMPVIGTVRKLSSKALDEKPLVILGDSHDPAAEAIRKLRGNLEFANLDGDLKSLFVTSALQHEGKTLTVCNLALSLAAADVRAVLVDGDLRRPQVHACFGLPNSTGVSTVLTGRTGLLEAVQSRTVGPRVTQLSKSGKMDAGVNGQLLYVLTSGPVPPNPSEVIASKSFANMIAELQDNFDIVLIDAPSILAVGDTAAMARCVDGMMFLIDLTRAKRPILEEAARQAAQMPCRKLGLVVMRQAPKNGYSHDHYYHAQGESPLDAPPGKSGRRDRVEV
jgi:capsular exopolysaccharide synthesis family protein